MRYFTRFFSIKSLCNVACILHLQHVLMGLTVLQELNSHLGLVAFPTK